MSGTAAAKKTPMSGRARLFWRVMYLLAGAVIVALGLRTLGYLGGPDLAAGRGAQGVATTGTLAALTVHPEVQTPKYVRARFGTPWSDVDKNHCDTRDDVLARDLTDVVRDSRCRVVSGVLIDTYTCPDGRVRCGGRTIVFDLTGLTGTAKSKAASRVQIDHVVPLAEAWKSGAYAWDDPKRLRFANDMDNLRAVDGPTNERKGDRDPAKWKPPNRADWCRYVAQFVAVKDKWHLWVNTGERTAEARVLQTCPHQEG